MACAAVISDTTLNVRRTMFRRIALGLALTIAVAGIASLWLFTPLREWIDVRRAVAQFARFADAPFAPLVAIAAFAVGGLVMVPANVMIAVCILVFGPVLGALYAWLGSEFSAVVLYEIGRHLPAGALRDRFGDKASRLRARLHRHGVLAVTLVRIVPVAPYTVVNLVAGAAHVPRAPYLIGTALGMLPGIIISALLIDRVVAAITRPDAWTYALLALVAALFLTLVLVMRRRFVRDAAGA
jgi:phospholipase D1/2